jgi:Histidine kinase/Tetratricopeptide repeat
MRMKRVLLIWVLASQAVVGQTLPVAEQYIKSCEIFQMAGQRDSVRKYAVLARTLALAEHNPVVMAKAELFIGNGLMRSLPDSAYTLIRLSYDDFRQRDDVKHLTISSNTLGNYYAQTGNPPEAIRFYLLAKTYGEKYYPVHEPTRYPRVMASLHHNISTIYKDISDYNNALDHSVKAHRLAVLHNLKPIELATLIMQGSVLFELRQNEQAELIFRQALSLATDQNDLRSKGVVLNNLGNLSLLRLSSAKLNKQIPQPADAKRARAFYTEALAIARQQQDNPAISQRLNNLSNLALTAEDYALSKTYLQEALAHAEVSQSKTARMKALANLALNYVKTNEVVKAIETATVAVGLAKELKNTEVLSPLYRTLEEAYTKQNEFEKALTAQKAVMEARNKQYNTTSTAQIQDLQIRYETEKKQRAIELLTAQNRAGEAELRQRKAELTQKNYLLLAIGAGLLLLLGGLWFWVRQRSAQQKQLAAEMKQRLLRAQLNPHFLFNSLNSIQRLYVEGRIAQANDFIADFAQLMRDILEKTGRTTIPLYEEIDFIEAYLSLEKRRLGNKFDYEIVMNDDLRHSEIEVPSFIIQPLAENALLHGVLPREGQKGKIDVIVERHGQDDVSICVQDNGVGYYHSLQRTDRHTSRGMELIRTRLGKRGRVLIEEIKNLNQEVLGTRIELQLTV